MRGVDFFTAKEPCMLCVICIEGSFFKKKKYIYFQDLFDLSNKQTLKIDIS